MESNLAVVGMFAALAPVVLAVNQSGDREDRNLGDFAVGGLDRKSVV